MREREREREREKEAAVVIVSKVEGLKSSYHFFVVYLWLFLCGRRDLFSYMFNYYEY